MPALTFSAKNEAITKPVGGLKSIGGDGKDPLLSGITEVGCGYNVVNGDYASATSCKSLLFTLDAQGYVTTTFPRGTNYSVPKLCTVHPNPGSTYYTTAGETLESVAKSLSSKTSIEGGYGCFSASLKVDYDESSTSESMTSYSRVQMNANLYTVSLEPLTEMRKYVRENVKNDLLNLDPNQLFDQYGTHYLNSCQMGGRAVYASKVNRNTFKSHQDLKVVAQASYKGLVGSLSAEENVALSNDISSFRQSSSSKCTTSGGNPALGGEGIIKNLQAWVESVNDYPDFVDFVDKDSLIPIWMLLDPSNTARIQQLKTAYEAYMKAHESSFSQYSGPALKYRLVEMRIQYTDRGSGAKDDLTVFKPDIGGDWYYLGQVAQGGYPSGTTTKGLVVSEIQKGALADIAKWQCVWNDKGSGKDKDYSLWRGLAADPVNYICLGDFFRGGVNNQNPPDQNETAGLKAVRSDLLISAKCGGRVWCDKGTGADADGAVFQIAVDDPKGVNPGLFVAAPNHSGPTGRVLYVLNKDKIVQG